MTEPNRSPGDANELAGPAPLRDAADGEQRLQDSAGFDAHGIDPLDAASRTSSAKDQFWIWAGANLAPINWVLGTVGISLGLSLTQTIIVIVVGNAFGAVLFGAFCVMGAKTGVPAMVLTRFAFGRRGAYIPAFGQVVLPMVWIGVNTWVVLDLVTAALARMGVTGGSGLQYLVAAIIMVVQVAIATWGYYAIEAFERWTMPVVFVIMLLMTGAALIHVRPAHTAAVLTGMQTIAAMSQLTTVIGVGWSIAWIAYAADYTRFTKPTMSTKSVFKTTAWAMFVPVVWLASLGAFIAASGSGTDPAELVITAFGALALPILLLIVHGPVATNIVVTYSSTLAALALDLKIARWKLTLVAGAVGSMVLWGLLQSESFAKSISAILGSLVIWTSPWAGILLVDYFYMRRARTDLSEIYGDPHDLIDVRWPALIGLALGMAAGWACGMGSVGVLQGPLAQALGGTDLSWLAAMSVGAATYLIFCKVWSTRFAMPFPSPADSNASASPRDR